MTSPLSDQHHSTSHNWYQIQFNALANPFIGEVTALFLLKMIYCLVLRLLLLWLPIYLKRETQKKGKHKYGYWHIVYMQVDEMLELPSADASGPYERIGRAPIPCGPNDNVRVLYISADK